MGPRLAACLVFALVLFAAGARAGSYEDFNAGVAALGRGDADSAIAFFSRALEAGDLPQNLRPVAHLDRGLAYARSKRPTEAASDATAALSLKPDYVEAYALRADLYVRQGRLAEGLADLDAAIRIKPDRHDLQRLRGLVHWEFGKFPEAANDFAQASRLSPAEPYSVIWRALAAGRTGPVDKEQLKEAARSLDLQKWPGPVVKLFLERWTVEEVLRAGARPGAPLEDPACEASFYVAEWYLLRNEPAKAKPLFEKAVATCPKHFIELHAAEVELMRTPFP